MHNFSTRRQFLQTTALASVAATLQAATASADNLVVDSHLHCFAGLNDERFPFHANAPYRPAGVASPENLLK